MSYTNQTQHYGLPQYVGTDVPAWLTDVNGAFATIDQGMNAAKTQADNAATAAGQAANDIVAINSTLGTQAGQISAAANAAAAAQTTANTADGKADTNAQSISGLDTRVTALEQGSGGADLEIVEIPFSGGITNTLGSLYITGAIPYQHPAGHTKEDIVSAEFIGSAGAFILLDSDIYLCRPNAVTSMTGKIVVYYNKRA